MPAESLGENWLKSPAVAGLTSVCIWPKCIGTATRPKVRQVFNTHKHGQAVADECCRQPDMTRLMI